MPFLACIRWPVTTAGDVHIWAIISFSLLYPKVQDCHQRGIRCDVPHLIELGPSIHRHDLMFEQARENIRWLRRGTRVQR